MLHRLFVFGPARTASGPHLPTNHVAPLGVYPDSAFTQPPTDMPDRSLDETVRREMRNQQYVESLWLRALAENDGNDAAARRTYRTLRTAQLRRQIRRRRLMRTAKHGAFGISVGIFGVVALCSILLAAWSMGTALAPASSVRQHLHVGLFFAILAGVSGYAAYLLWQQWMHVMKG